MSRILPPGHPSAVNLNAVSGFPSGLSPFGQVPGQVPPLQMIPPQFHGSIPVAQTKRVSPMNEPVQQGIDPLAFCPAQSEDSLKVVRIAKLIAAKYGILFHLKKGESTAAKAKEKADLLGCLRGSKRASIKDLLVQQSRRQPSSEKLLSGRRWKRFVKALQPDSSPPSRKMSSKVKPEPCSPSTASDTASQSSQGSQFTPFSISSPRQLPQTSRPILMPPPQALPVLPSQPIPTEIQPKTDVHEDPQPLDDSDDSELPRVVPRKVSPGNPTGLATPGIPMLRPPGQTMLEPRNNDDLLKAPPGPAFSSSPAPPTLIELPVPPQVYSYEEFEDIYREALMKTDLHQSEGTNQLLRMLSQKCGSSMLECQLDWVIDKAFNFYNEALQTPGRLPDSLVMTQEDHAEYRRVDTALRVILEKVNRIPNTIRVSVKQEGDKIFRVIEHVKSPYGWVPNDVDRMLNLELDNLLVKIQTQYPKTNDYLGAEMPFPDMNHLAVDLNEKSPPLFVGHSLKNKILPKISLWGKNCRLKHKLLRLANQKDTHVYKSLFFHPAQSLDRLNRTMAKLLANFKAMEICPLSGRPMGALEDAVFQRFYLLLYLRFKERFNLEFGQAMFANITFMNHAVMNHSVDQEPKNIGYGLNEDIVEDLCDVRSEFALVSEKKVEKFKYFIDQGYIYLCPNFLQHFDVKGITDVGVLRWRMYFTALQLGCFLHPEYSGNENSMKGYWESAMIFECRVGWSHHLSKDLMADKPNIKQGFYYYSQIRKRTEEQDAEFKYWHGLKPCEFKVHYRRFDPDDVTSEYALVKFNMAHSHPITPSFHTNNPFGLKDRRRDFC